MKNDPQVKETRFHLEDLYSKQRLAEIQIAKDEKRLAENQKKLDDDRALLNQTIGAIKATKDLMHRFRDID